MGEIVKISCTSCKAEWECMIGCGLQHGNLKRVADLYFPDDIKQKIEDYAARTEFPSFDFRFQLSYCAYCKSIESVPVLHLNETDTDYIGVCEKCGEKTELIENIEDTKCPVCQKTSLKSEDAGRWD